MAAFPSYARVLLAGFNQARESGVTRTQMESGPPKQLKTKSRVLVTRSVRVLFNSKTDFLTFVTWFQSTVNFGADWFTWTDPVDGVSKNARIVGSLGREAPVAGGDGAWSVDAQIETWSA